MVTDEGAAATVLEHSMDGGDGWVIEDHVAVVPASDHQAVVVRAAGPNRRQQPLGAIGDEHVPPRIEIRSPPRRRRVPPVSTSPLTSSPRPLTSSIRTAPSDPRAITAWRSAAREESIRSPALGGAADHQVHVREPVPRALEEDRRSQGDVDALAAALEGDLLPRGRCALSRLSSSLDPAALELRLRRQLDRLGLFDGLGGRAEHGLLR